MPTGDELAAKLEGAVKEESESATDTEAKTQSQTGSEETAGTKEKASSDSEGKETRESKGSQSVPYDRFKQKVDQVQSLEDQLKDVKREAEQYQQKEENLRRQVVQLEQEHDVLERLRGLADDDRYRPLLERLDKALRGIDEEVQQGEKTEEEGKEAARKLFEKEKGEISDAFEKQKAELIFQRANLVAERMLGALPDTYNSTDKSWIQKAWASSVDWDRIEQDPDQHMQDELQRSFKSVVEEYGEPRGALLQAKEELNELKSKAESETAPEKAKTPEEIVSEIVEGKEWGKVNRNDDGKVLGPEHDDSEFARDMANVWKIANKG